MSQRIRISTGFGPTALHYIPKNICIFPTKLKHTCMDVSYPEEECRKRAWLSVGSNRNPRPPVPFLLYATSKDVPFPPYSTWDWENEGLNKGVTGRSKNDDLIIMSTVRVLRVLTDNDDLMDSLGVGHETLLGALEVWKERRFELDSSKEMLAIVTILMDLNDPNDGFTVLNDALEVWNALLWKVQFDANEEDKIPFFFRWGFLMAVTFVLNKLCTPAEFIRARSLILAETID